MRLLWSLLVNCWLILWSPLRALRYRAAAPRGAFLSLRLDGPVVELAQRRRFWARGPGPTSLMAVGRALELAARDPRVVGLVVSLHDFGAGAAATMSLRGLLEGWRKSGKLLVVHLPMGASGRELYLASVANQVYLAPETWVLPLGYSVESPYLRRVLDRFGVEPRVFARGEYKTAAESISRAQMSEAQTEQLSALLDDSWERLVTSLTEGRGVSREQAEAWIHRSPYDAEEAAALKLVDGVLDDDELELRLGELSGRTAGERAPVLALGRYAARRSFALRPMLRRRHIKVVQLSGAIVSKAQGGAQLGVLAVDDDVCEALAEVQHDPKVMGVVLQVNSRGGSALASDRILRAVKRLAAEKPVVAYLGDVAASGGYMVALGARAIVAQPACVTGSIGVVAASVTVEGLIERVGVQVERIARGEHAGMMSPLRRLKESEAERMEALIDAGYRRFVQSVATARGKAFEELEPLARGRVWSARAAHERGLIDELGGLEVAVERVRRALGGMRLMPVAVGTSAGGSPLTALLGRGMALGALGPLLSWLLGALGVKTDALTLTPGALGALSGGDSYGTLTSALGALSGGDSYGALTSALGGDSYGALTLMQGAQSGASSRLSGAGLWLWCELWPRDLS